MENISLQKILKAIDENRSFILEAGAGSGKTHTLIQALNHILENYSGELSSAGKKIACITFTNVAKDEIIERTKHNNLIVVQTIHQFLWSCVENYQSSLHVKLCELNDEYERQRREEGRRCSYEYIENLGDDIRDLNITYTEYGRNFRQGKLTHEDIIAISYLMFRDYPSLSKIVSDKYPYIFIDEYQDTEEETIKSLFEYHLKIQEGRIVLGLFGDSMQKIYDQGVGNIDSSYYSGPDSLLEFITKEENYRCSTSVIKLLNNVRNDLTQKAAGENSKIEGKSIFLFGRDNHNDYVQYLNDKGWNFESSETKILLLTHTGIAKGLNYTNLLKVFGSRYGQFGRDMLFKKENIYSDFFLGENGLESLVDSYYSGEYGKVIPALKQGGYTLRSHNDKERVREVFENLNHIRENGSIGSVLEFVRKNELLRYRDKMTNFEKFIEKDEIEKDLEEKHEKDKKFYNDLIALSYKEVANVYNFIEKNTIFSTKHGTKGDEYSNVLVVIDDSAWRQSYNFSEMFLGKSKYPERLSRTLNLFYVCCSRAKTELAVATVSEMSSDVMSEVVEWFGDENVFEVN